VTTITPQSIGQLFRLDGKVALVPGGYGGIGASVCWGLAAAGAQIAVAGHNAERTLALADELNAAGYPALAVPFDADSVADIRRMVDAAAAHFGRLDILVNCVASTARKSCWRSPKPISTRFTPVT